MREPISPAIVHRDRHLLVIDKPSGLPTTSPAGDERSLVHWVQHEVTDGAPAHPTSRLDSPVSGLVTFALTSHANRHLLAAREEGRYSRAYLGITAEPPSFAECEWSWPISIHPTNPKLRVAAAGKGEREALTRCLVVARAQTGALLRLTPATGRTHQIRVHAAQGGVPLFGDHAYGGVRRAVLTDGRVASARRAMLHCARLSFPKIDADGEFVLESSVPGDFRRAWAGLGGSPEACAEMG